MYKMTKSTDVVHNASEFVSTFLKSHAKDALAAWSAVEVQGSYSKLFDALNRKRKGKSQDLPKRGKSSYLFFCQDMRQKVKDKNPSLSSKEITVELGVMWNKIKDDSAAIAKYVSAASKDKERYDQEKKTRVSSVDVPAESAKTAKPAPARVRSAKPKAEVKPETPAPPVKPVVAPVADEKPKSRRGGK
jgi:hypothetical protein